MLQRPKLDRGVARTIERTRSRNPIGEQPHERLRYVSTHGLRHPRDSQQANGFNRERYFPPRANLPSVSLTGFVPPTCDFRPHVPDRTDSYAGAVSEIRYVSRMRRCGTSRASGGRRPRRAIEKSISFIDGGSMSMTPVLPQGCCIVSGTVTSRPSRIQAYKLELEKQPRGND